MSLLEAPSNRWAYCTDGEVHNLPAFQRVLSCAPQRLRHKALCGKLVRDLMAALPPFREETPVCPRCRERIAS